MADILTEWLARKVKSVDLGQVMEVVNEVLGQTEVDWRKIQSERDTLVEELKETTAALAAARRELEQLKVQYAKLQMHGSDYAATLRKVYDAFNQMQGALFNGQ